MAADPSVVRSKKPSKSGRVGEPSAKNGGDGYPQTYQQEKARYSQDPHRSPPHSLEAEQGVLGSMLLSPNNVIAEVVEAIGEEDYFFNPVNTTIYQLLVEMWNAQEAIDLITFTQRLRDKNLLEQVGGAAYVTPLFTFVPTAANVKYY